MNAGYAFREDEDPVFFPGDFDSELVDDCIPFIDAKYRTLADKRHRAVSGLSLGSVQAFYTAMKHRELFGSLGVFSGGFPVKRSEYDYSDYFKDKDTVNSDFDLIFTPEAIRALSKPRSILTKSAQPALKSSITVRAIMFGMFGAIRLMNSFSYYSNKEAASYVERNAE